MFQNLLHPFRSACLPKSPTPDQVAAHEFLTELRTRITTQPLPYQHGVEARALESLWEVFGQARDAIKKHPGGGQLAGEITDVLNLHVRPVTAKWHRAHAEGRLKSRDGADEFRVALLDLQGKLQDFTKVLHLRAYGTEAMDRRSPSAMPAREMLRCLADLPFGIPAGALGYRPDEADAAAGKAKLTFSQETAATTKLRGQINSSEASEVLARRGERKVGESRPINAVGLAFSGGGIRSAAFSLGAAQIFEDRGLLKQVDFLSTVSGGGYTGSFLSRRLDAGEDAGIGGVDRPDPLPIRYLRLHAKYLAARSLKESWSMVTATLAGTLLNWTAPLLLLLLAAEAAVGLKMMCHDHSWHVSPWEPVALEVAGGLTAIAMVVYAGLVRCRRTVARWSGNAVAGLAGVTFAVGALWLLHAGYGWFTWLLVHPITLGSICSLTALATAGPQVIRYLPVLRNPQLRTTVLQVLLVTAGVVIPLLAVVLFYTFCTLVGVVWPEDWAIYLLAGLPAVFTFVSVFLLNINLTGPHRLYRDGLARTFVQTCEDDDKPVKLTDTNVRNRGPYHLINATLNVPSSDAPALRDRRSDFFLFSKHWCGSPVISYYPTEKWQTDGEPVDLATAMAISGAAISANMGLGSMPSLRALLTFLNVRLGFWIRHPDHFSFFHSPGFFCLLREMTGIAMSERKPWLNLSDGGHIENMGAYELLRRRCKYIICVDGEADPGYTFGGLLTLVRHAQIDFGIRLEPRTEQIRPDAETKSSHSHATLFRIHYPSLGDQPAGLGLFLYMKLSLTGNESELIKRCRIDHPSFPHQTTLDQFYDEEQFEAYRQLGMHIADGLFSRALMTMPEGWVAQPYTIKEWFRALAANLLEPEPARTVGQKRTDGAS